MAGHWSGIPILTGLSTVSFSIGSEFSVGSGMTLDLRDVGNELLQLTLNPRDTVILDETIRIVIDSENSENFIPYSLAAIPLPRRRRQSTRKSGLVGHKRSKRASRRDILFSFAWPIIIFWSRIDK